MELASEKPGDDKCDTQDDEGDAACYLAMVPLDIHVQLMLPHCSIP